MRNESDAKEEKKVLAEYVHMYYEHQYDRMAKLEEQRLTITNVVITLSIVAFTFGFSNSQNLTEIVGIGLPAVMVASNLFAIVYIVRSADFIGTHRRRAKRILELYAQELHELDESIQWPHRLWARWRIQVLIHILLILAALFPAYVYLRSVIR